MGKPVKALGIAALVLVGARLFFGALGTASAAQLVLMILGALFLLLLLVVIRFDFFVAFILLIRTSVDYTKADAAPRASGVMEATAAVAVLFMGAGIVWMLTRGRHAPRFRAPMTGPFQVFMVTLFLSVVTSTVLLTSLTEFARIMAVFIMVLVLERLMIDRKVVDKVLIACFLSALPPIVLGISQALNRTRLLDVGGFERIRGTFRHPNPYALYLAVIITMGVAIYPHLSKIGRRWMISLLSIAFVAMLLTYTRTGWISVVIGLLIVGFLQSKKLLGIIFVGIAILLATVPSVAGRFSDLDEGRYLKGGAAKNSLLWRMDYWTEALHLAKKNPVTGIGLKGIASNLDEQKQPHNDFVRVYVETGLVGLFGYIALIVGLARTARRARRRARPGIDRGIAVGFSGLVAIFIASSIVSNILSQVVLLWYFYAFGIAAAAVSHKAEPVRVPKQNRLPVPLPAH